MALKKLKAPESLKIDFCPSPKQYELWKLLQPECPLCGGEVEQMLIGYDANHNPRYKPASVATTRTFRSWFWAAELPAAASHSFPAYGW